MRYHEPGMRGAETETGRQPAGALRVPHGHVSRGGIRMMWWQSRRAVAELHVTTHRNGPLGVVAPHFDARTTRFASASLREASGRCGITAYCACPETKNWVLRISRAIAPVGFLMTLRCGEAAQAAARKCAETQFSVSCYGTRWDRYASATRHSRPAATHSSLQATHKAHVRCAAARSRESIPTHAGFRGCPRMTG